MTPRLIAHRLNRAAKLRRGLLWSRAIPGLWLECDVRTTADRVLVACHDASWRGRPVQELRWSDLPAEVLSLDEVLRQIRPTGAVLHLDVKALRGAGQWQAAVEASRLMALLERHAMTRRVIVSALAGSFLRRLRRLSPPLRLGVILDAAYGEPQPRNLPALQRLLAKLLAFHWAVRLEAVFLNQAWLRTFDRRWRFAEKFFGVLRGAGLRPVVWTVNDPAWARRLLALGADRLTTDDPGRLWQVLNRPEARERSDACRT